jgi:hypothetical protein
VIEEKKLCSGEVVQPEGAIVAKKKPWQGFASPPPSIHSDNLFQRP